MLCEPGGSSHVAVLQLLIVCGNCHRAVTHMIVKRVIHVLGGARASTFSGFTGLNGPEP